mmetsp:Transcript_37724/g.59705  ORF Transcript_37724/g.59705 Transcript_37724/m.59705 type:complete len:223 (+) Transcript_37724:162-830(+)
MFLQKLSHILVVSLNAGQLMHNIAAISGAGYLNKRIIAFAVYQGGNENLLEPFAAELDCSLYHMACSSVLCELWNSKHDSLDNDVFAALRAIFEQMLHNKVSKWVPAERLSFQKNLINQALDLVGRKMLDESFKNSTAILMACCHDCLSSEFGDEKRETRWRHYFNEFHNHMVPPRRLVEVFNATFQFIYKENSFTAPCKSNGFLYHSAAMLGHRECSRRRE